MQIQGESIQLSFKHREKASGPHFSGLSFDGLLSSSPPNSSVSSPSHLRSAVSPIPKLLSSLSLLNLLLGFNQIWGFIYLIVLGVSGRTSSGKTTVCDMIIQQLHDHRVVLVNQVWSKALAFYGSFILGGICAGMLIEAWIDKKVKAIRDCKPGKFGF